MNDKEHLFWAVRWAHMRRLFKKLHQPYTGATDIAMSNYAIYLAEVYSFLFERRKNHV